MKPGQHVIIISDHFSQSGRNQDWELRDTILIIGRPKFLYAFLFRVPLAKPTVAEQILETGTGGLWVDGCRIQYQSENDKASAKPQGIATGRPGRLAGKFQGGGIRTAFEARQGTGRWPTNLILIHRPGCTLDNNIWSCSPGCMVKALDQQSGDRPSTGPYPSNAKLLSKYRPTQGNYQPQGPLYSDSGGASRFYPQFASLPEAVSWLDNLVNG